MTRLFIATRNTHKINEIRAILGDSFEILSQRDITNTLEIIEDGDTFEANAKKKSEGLALWLVKAGHDIAYVLADDSGLEVDALNGAPGVYSARFAAIDTGKEGNSPDTSNNEKLLICLKDIPPQKRTARFHCVIALTRIVKKNDSISLETKTFDGRCEGHIGFAVKGNHGFGYDPLFIPNGLNQTFAELGESTKNQISHRSKALANLMT